MSATHNSEDRANPQELVDGEEFKPEMRGGRMASPAISTSKDGDAPVEGGATEGAAAIIEPTKARMVAAALKEIAQIVLPAVTLGLLIHLFLAQATIVRGQSMQPNFRPSERLVMEKLAYYFREPRRNEIVVLDMPGSSVLMIKRVIGLPGEKVEIRQGHVFVNDSEVAPPQDIAPRWRVLAGGEEVKASSQYGDSHSFYGPITLDEDTYFVLGDNRDNSNDSRAFGAAARDAIRGRVWVRYWPLTRFTIFR